MSDAPLSADLQRLRSRFVALLVAEGVAGALAAALLVGYFVFRLGVCLPAFAGVLALAAAAQVAFILAFRRGSRAPL